MIGKKMNEVIDSIGIALLAAGKGSRLKFDVPKVLCPILGKRMIDYVLWNVAGFCNENSLTSQYGVVVGHGKEELIKYLKESDHKELSFAVQEEQRGTADALRSYFAGTEGSWDKKYTMVICGDTPLINARILNTLYDEFSLNVDLEAVCASFMADAPKGYGRIINEGIGFKIVEEKETNDEQKLINEVNSALYIFKTSYIKKYLNDVSDDNKTGEFYLTDFFKVDEHVKALCFPKEEDFIGVNTLVQLEVVSKVIKKKRNNELQESGVFILDSDSTYIEYGVEIEPGSTILPNSFIYAGTKIKTGSFIENNVVIKNSLIDENVKIFANSYLEDAHVRKGASIGPFARLRPNADIGEDSKIGNFVEIKKSKLHKGVKVSHLSYLGDAEVGEDSNIGCGFISCNYDGANKHKTIIGSGCFIGSDVQVVAPVKIGNNSFVAAGSTINQDVPDDSFAVARSRQVNKEGIAKRFIKTKK
jgi:bifunctional UDP-N-acetylglucosamine pyrophosphorylase/glucosamine-1-phosphate N-acetyltransferase